MTRGFTLFLAIFLMAAATALTRFLPFVIYSHGRKPPEIIR